MPSLFENGPVLLSNFWRQRFFEFCYLIFFLPFETGHDPSFEESWIPFTHLWLVPSLVEIGQLVHQKEIFKFPQFIFPYFFIITPWKKGMVLHLNKLIFLSLNYAVCHVWLNLAHGSGEEVKMWQLVYKQADRQMDTQTTNILWSEKLTWAFSSSELKPIGDSRCLKLRSPKVLDPQSKTGVPFLFSIQLSKFTPDL